MSIRVQCHKCHRTVKAGDDWAGRAAKCPSCGATIAIPQSDLARIVGEPAGGGEDLDAWMRNNVNANANTVAADLAQIGRMPPEPQPELVNFERRGEADGGAGQEVEWARHRALLAKLDELKQQRVVVTEVRLRFENMVGLVLQFWFATLAAAFLLGVAGFVVLLLFGFVAQH